MLTKLSCCKDVLNFKSYLWLCCGGGADKMVLWALHSPWASRSPTCNGNVSSGWIVMKYQVLVHLGGRASVGSICSLEVG